MTREHKHIYVAFCLILAGATVAMAQDGQASPDAVKFKTLFSFDGTDGAFPQENLVQGFDGNLYGTTTAGGASSNGNVFRLTPGGAVTSLYDFCSQRTALMAPFPTGTARWR